MNDQIEYENIWRDHSEIYGVLHLTDSIRLFKAGFPQNQTRMYWCLLKGKCFSLEHDPEKCRLYDGDDLPEGERRAYAAPTLHELLSYIRTEPEDIKQDVIDAVVSWMFKDIECDILEKCVEEYVNMKMKLSENQNI